MRNPRPWSIPPRATKNSPDIRSVPYGLAFPLDIPVPVKRRLNRRLSRVSAWNVVLNDIK